MILHFSVLTLLLACSTQAIQVKPGPSYGPPPSGPQHFPHREYGVPQKMPFREYGPPALKYGPPKLNFIGGGGGGGSSSSGGLHEQIKTHFGVPKPFYGPPHKPSQQYGPPPPKQQYGPPPPKPQYGPPKPQYGPPPQKIQHNPAPAYGPPKPNYGPPPPQALPLVQPAPIFKPQHQPSSSYGPPPSGPLSQPPKPQYGPPPPSNNYGPPPLPNFQKVPDQGIILTGNQNGGHGHGNGQQQQQQQQVQIQIDASGHTHSVAGSQAPFHTACDGWKPIPAPVGSYVEHNHIDTQSGYSQVSQDFGHTGAASSFSSTQYSAAGGNIGGGGNFGAGGNSGAGGNFGGSGGGDSSTITISGSDGIEGLTDEQLVAVALQSGGFDGDNTIQHEILPQALPSTGPAGDFNHQVLNEIEAQALQLTLGSDDDSYSKPPSDSYAPGSVHSAKFNSASSSSSSSSGHSSFGVSGSGGNYGPPPPPNGNYGPPPPQPQGNYGPPPPPNGNYGPPPQQPHGNYGPPPPPNGNYGPPQRPNGNYGPPPPQPHGNYGPPPPPPNGNYGPPPPPPNGNYGPPPPQSNGNFGGPPQSQGAAAFVHHHAQAGLGIQYGKQSGNVANFPPHHGAPPSKPVAFRPPVPQGLFETIGNTVQHLDQFGVKPNVQAPTYIPPAANEIPQTGPGNLNIEYGPPPQQQQQQQQLPQVIIEQQLPVPQQAQLFVQQNQHQQQQQHHHHHQQQQQQQIQQQQQHEQHNSHAEYGVPPQQPQGLPPPPQYLPAPPPAQIQQQYLPSLPSGPQQQFASGGGGGASYTSSAQATYENAFSATQYNHQIVHAQALPLEQQQPRFHDCGHGPNLVGGGIYNYQQQQQQQYSNGGSASIAQSIPVAEQHSQFLTGPANSYGPPPSGINDYDHIGYASEKSQVTALPDGTNPEGLPGLESLNVLSAQKSQSIHFSSQNGQNGGQSQSYQVQFGGNGASSSNHDEILTAGLLQTVLNAVEQPQQQHQPLPPNHKAEARSDINIHDEPVLAEDPNEPEVAKEASEKVEVKVKPDADASLETPADVKELKPIVVKEENEAKH